MPNYRQIISTGRICLLLTALNLALNTSAAAQVTFTDIQPILQQRCVMCHSGEAAPLGLKLETLKQLLKGSVYGPVLIAGNATESKLYKRLTGSTQPRMPMTGPPFLTDSQIDLFKQWIEAGLPAGEQQAEALSQAPVPIEPVSDDKINFSHVAPIFATRCAKCHTDNGLMGEAPEGYRLTSYASILSASHRVRVVPGKPAASELLRRIKGQAVPRMPFDGPPYLSDEEIHKIQAWIANGAPDGNGRVAKIPGGARIRLHGHLIDGWLLDGLPLEINRNTRQQKHPGQGDYVRVRGVIDDEGNVSVERIRRR